MVALVIATHALFWLVVAARLLARPDRHRPSPDQTARPRHTRAVGYCRFCVGIWLAVDLVGYLVTLNDGILPGK